MILHGKAASPVASVWYQETSCPTGRRPPSQQAYSMGYPTGWRPRGVWTRCVSQSGSVESSPARESVQSRALSGSGLGARRFDSLGSLLLADSLHLIHGPPPTMAPNRWRSSMQDTRAVRDPSRSSAQVAWARCIAPATRAWTAVSLVKVLAPALASEADFRARFAREAKAISALNHAHIEHLSACGRYRVCWRSRLRDTSEALCRRPGWAL